MIFNKVKRFFQIYKIYLIDQFFKISKNNNIITCLLSKFNAIAFKENSFIFGSINFHHVIKIFFIIRFH